MFYVGVDLAWSRNNHTGIVVLNDDECVLMGIVKSDNEIIRVINELVEKNPCRVAIDAPLTVPNETGSRVAEKELNAVFRKYEAGAHPANRSWFLRSSKAIRGEELVAELEKRYIRHDPFLKADRCCFEVYPHPATIRLFGLHKTLKYKPRQHRTYQERYEAFEVYMSHLRSYGIRGVDELLSTDVRSLKGKALKDHEDILDALLCAIIAKDIHERGSEMFGNEHEGYILVPIAAHPQEEDSL